MTAAHWSRSTGFAGLLTHRDPCRQSTRKGKPDETTSAGTAAVARRDRGGVYRSLLHEASGARKPSSVNFTRSTAWRLSASQAI